MRVLILGLNYAPEEIGIGRYTTGMARALADAGHEVEVVAGKPYYPEWRVPSAFARPGWLRDCDGSLRVIRCPHYVPSDPTGAKRVAHHASFAAAAAVPAIMAARRLRPDIVIAVAPSLISAPVAKAAAQVAGAQTWLHVQDFEVEAAFATGLVGASGRIARIARRFERAAMGGFDRYSSISPAMCAKLVAFGIPAERVLEMRNWAEVDSVRVLNAPSPFRAEWGITARHVALYSGNVSHKQGVGILLDAARRLAHRDDLAFVVCGSGPQMERFRKDAAGLANVHLHPLQPIARVGDLLGLATVHLLPQLGGAADLVLPSKLTNMLASGRPVVATAAPSTGLADEVDGCGVVTPPEDAAAFAAAIQQLCDDESLRTRLGQSARRRAEERWSKHAILEGLLHELTAFAAGKLES